MNFIPHWFLLRIFLLLAQYWFAFPHAPAYQITASCGKRHPRVERSISRGENRTLNIKEADLKELFKTDERDTMKAIEVNPSIDSFESRQKFQDFINECHIDKKNIREIIFSDADNGYNLNKEHLTFLKQHSPKINNRELLKSCEKEDKIQCNDKKYPSVNGTCNNLERPNEGSPDSCIERFISPDETPGEHDSRVSRCFSLPDPKKVGEKLQNDYNCCSLSHNITVMLSTFGLFIDRDIQYTYISTDIRQMMNLATAAIDGSQIYGSKVADATLVRKKDGNGKLHFILSEVGQLPPPHPKLLKTREVSEVSPPQELEKIPCSTDYPCFLTGDLRYDHNLPLASLHITFFRMHNLIADKLKELNPTWDEETLFQESRLINIFILQNIAFKEYLPLTVGQDLVDKYQLGEDDTEYNSSLPLMVFHSFATASVILRQTLPNTYLISELGVLKILPMNDAYFDMEYIYKYGIENIIRGATRQKQKNPYPIQTGCSDDTSSKASSNLDVLTEVIQLGRDIRLSGYVFHVFYLRGIRIKNFDDLHYFNLMKESVIGYLKSLYKFVEDIDLFVGLICEKPLSGRVLGETIATIISLQFHFLKFGSRFTYTHKGMLTAEQKQTILSIKLSHVFCYANNMPQIAEDTFNRKSTIIRCDNIPPFDLSAWKGRPRQE